jgi:drug/metabolite transporter (DMT)-like permease
VSENVSASPLRLALAFVVVYVVWGSTYLGIRIAVLELPPALLTGVRFSTAGVLMILLSRAMGHRLPCTWPEWRLVFVMAFLLIVLGNCLVVWAEQWVPSNQAALLVSSSALWTAWFGTFGARAQALDGVTVTGLLTGFAGVVLLMWPQPGVEAAVAEGAGGAGPLVARFAMLFAAVSWSFGAIYSRNHPVPTAPLMAAAWQMLIAGLFLLAVGLVSGEHTAWRWSPRGLAAVAYLTVFGSCIAYATYAWLIHHATPARLGTTGYVNPLIAVLLGWLVLGERLTGVQLAGTGVIISGVLIIALHRVGGRRVTHREEV